MDKFLKLSVMFKFALNVLHLISFIELQNLCELLLWSRIGKQSLLDLLTLLYCFFLCIRWLFLRPGHKKVRSVEVYRLVRKLWRIYRVDIESLILRLHLLPLFLSVSFWQQFWSIYRIFQHSIRHLHFTRRFVLLHEIQLLSGVQTLKRKFLPLHHSRFTALLPLK